MYYVKDIESFGTGLKRITDECDAAGVKVEFKIMKMGFTVVFYRPNNGSSVYNDVEVGTETHDATTVTLTDTHAGTHTDTPTVTPTDSNSQIDRILSYCTEPRSRIDIQLFVGLKDKNHFLKNYLNPLVESGKLKMTVPDKPNSKNQKYVRNGRKNAKNE